MRSHETKKSRRKNLRLFPAKPRTRRDPARVCARNGTRMVVDGQARGTAIPGEDFYAAVLRIRLGDKLVDAGPKKGLLGA